MSKRATLDENEKDRILKMIRLERTTQQSSTDGLSFLVVGKKVTRFTKNGDRRAVIGIIAYNSNSLYQVNIFQDDGAQVEEFWDHLNTGRYFRVTKKDIQFGYMINISSLSHIHLTENSVDEYLSLVNVNFYSINDVRSGKDGVFLTELVGVEEVSPPPGGNYRYIRCVSCWSEADEYCRKCGSNDTEPAISITVRFTGDGGSNFKYTLSNNLLEHFLNLLQVNQGEYLYYPTSKEIADRIEHSCKIRLFLVKNKAKNLIFLEGFAGAPSESDAEKE
jgi:hypothetical protein